jgi:hypothetical protein
LAKRLTAMADYPVLRWERRHIRDSGLALREDINHRSGWSRLRKGWPDLLHDAADSG